MAIKVLLGHHQAKIIWEQGSKTVSAATG